MENQPLEESATLLRRAIRFSEFGEYIAARDVLKTAVENDSNFADGWYTLGTVYEKLGDPVRARECLQKASLLRPEWTDPLIMLAQIEYNLKRYKETKDVLMKYLKLGGTNIDTLMMLAQSAFHLSDCKSVLAATSRIIELDEHVSKAWELRGLCHARMSNFSSACVSLNMAIELNPSSVTSLNTVGDMCYESRNFTGAVDCYGPSLKKRKKQPAILFRYGTCLWFLERWNEAISVLKQYTQMSPDDPAGWNNLGVALREKGEVVRALECYKKALQLNPDLAEPRNNLETAAKKQVIL